MHWFIPYLDTPTFDRALGEAARLAQSDDCVTVMAPVVVPGDLPVDVDAGLIWKQVCLAERRLFHARETAQRILPPAMTVDFIRVQARDSAGAIVAGAVYEEADGILLAQQAGIRATLSARFGTIAAVKRQAPCAVRIVGEASDQSPHEGMTARTTTREVADPFAGFHTIAVNPALHRPSTENRARTSEEQHAS